MCDFAAGDIGWVLPAAAILVFGYLGCLQIAHRRATRAISEMSEEQVAQKILDIREGWRREGLDVERIYKVAVLAHHYRADRWKCLPACCRPWGDIEPVMPPGPGAPLTMAQLDQAMMRAVPYPWNWSQPDRYLWSDRTLRRRRGRSLSGGGW